MAVRVAGRIVRIAVAVAVACTGGVAVTAAEQLPLSQDTATLAAVERAMEHYRLDAHIPGMVWGIVKDSRLVHVKGAGVQDVDTKRPVTADTLFRIASMTKSFTALSILKLRDEGKLSLDAPIDTYVPELRTWKYPTGDYRRFACASCSRTPPGSSPTTRGAIGRRRCQRPTSPAC